MANCLTPNQELEVQILQPLPNKIIWKVGRVRFNALVLKTNERGERSVGSNPTPSSNICSASLVVRTQAFHA